MPNIPFFSIDAPQFLQELVGRGSKSIRDVYAQNKGVIFIDEIDAIAKSRSFRPDSLTTDVLLQLLSCLDGTIDYHDRATIVATNQESLLDSALLSRIPQSNRLYFSLPDSLQRKLIIDKHLSYHQHKIKDISFLVSRTEGYDGRNLEDIFSNARINALNSDRDYLLEVDFNE